MIVVSVSSWLVVAGVTFAAGLAAAAWWRVLARISPPDPRPVRVDRFTVGPRVTVRARFACGCERWLDVPAAVLAHGVIVERCPVHRTRAVHIEREEAA